jgi:tetratricopeptide (TPR) repeat protein
MKCEEMDLTGFLESELDASQTSSVAQHLDGCVDCQERLRLLMDMRAHRKELRTVEPFPRRIYIWPIAAALLFVALIGYWVLFHPTDVTKLAANGPYPVIPPELRSSHAGDNFLSAVRAYAQNDWNRAEKEFRRYLAEHPKDYEASFYLANVLYAESRLDESERILSELARQNSQDNRVQWYLASLRLRQKDVVGARKHLQTVASKSGEFHEEAISLLRKLPH